MAAGYRLIIKPTAGKEIEKLPRGMQLRIAEAIGRIEQAPRGPGTVKLTGTKRTFRVRVGDWRIIYEIDDSARLVFVTIVGNRRDVYR